MPNSNNLTQSIVEKLGTAIVKGDYDEQPSPTEAKAKAKAL